MAQVPGWLSTLRDKNEYLKQDLTDSLVKNKTYRIVMKIKALTANPAGNVFQVQIAQKLTPYTAILDWTPTITTTATWHETTFTPTFSTDMAELYLNGLNVTGSWGACTGFDVDEIYIYEDIPADRLIIANHEFNNTQITSLYGCRCNPARTSFSYANDAGAALTSENINQTETVIESFTSANYPVWELTLRATTGITYEAGQMFLGPKFDLDYFDLGSFDPHASESYGTMIETIGGKRNYTFDFERGIYEFTVKTMIESDHDEWVEWWEEVGRSKYPHFFCWDETNEPEDIKFVRCEGAFSMPIQIYGAHYRVGQIKLREEK